MADKPNATSGPNENPLSNMVSGIEQKIKSNLSEVAQFVAPYLDKITLTMRDMGLVEKANELIMSKASPTSPEMVDFKLNCKEAETNVIAAVRAKNGNDPNGEAVVRNYFSKFTASLG